MYPELAGGGLALAGQIDCQESMILKPCNATIFCSLDLEPNKLSASTYDIYVVDVDAKQQNDAVRWFMQITSLMVPFKRLGLRYLEGIVNTNNH